MKMPNFRLPQTQAVTGAILSMLGLALMVVMAALVCKNWDPVQKVIWYNPQSKGWGKMREPMVFASCGLSVLAGIFAGSLGFNSLGQKRNERQGLSWLGLALGGLAIVLAMLLLVVWLRLHEQTVTPSAG